MKIKINQTKDLLYLLIFHISFFLRSAFSLIIIDGIYNLNSPYVFLFLMTLGELFGVSIVYIYQTLNLKKKKHVSHFQLPLIQNKSQKYLPEGKLKKILLIFFTSFFDFIEFIIIVFYASKVTN